MKAEESEAEAVRVLIIDDDEGHAEALAEGLESDGFLCRLAHSGEDGLAMMEQSTYDAILTDLVMHGVDGLAVLEESSRLQPEAVVLLITGHGSVATAVEAIRRGAADFIEKPVRIAELRTRLQRAVETRNLVRTNRELRQQLDKRFGFEGIIGHSAPMQRVFDILRQVSPTNATVLILGASGTGKELVARSIHENSPRKDRNFAAVNCAALSEGLIESELFGHVKGAFTGAVSAREGRIAYAHGGTLFLDEVGDMPLETQAKLLRVLETREVQPVGGNEVRKVDVRLVAATNRNLAEMVKEKTFREDLMFRLQVVTIEMPPLSGRPGDIPILIDHFLGELAQHHGRSIRGISPEARAILMHYEWPGNVRELRNVLENMVLLARDEILDVCDIPETLQRSRASAAEGALELAGRSLAEVEKALIEANLKFVEGNRQKAAKIMGIGERTLYRKLKEYGLS